MVNHDERVRAVALDTAEPEAGRLTRAFDDRARAREPLLALLAHPSAPIDHTAS